MDNKWLYIFLIFLLVVIIILFIVIFVHKDRVFNAGKHLGAQPPKVHAQKGYGTYYKAFDSPCITTDGKCNTPGINYTTYYCLPHPDTGKGCINDDGEQTYNAKSVSNVCKANCKNFVFNEITEFNNVCQYDNPYNLPAYTCIPPNARSYEYRKFDCIKNDSIGDNTCTYTCGKCGTDSAGIKGDVDPTKESYIPACAARGNQTITLNSLNWNNILNIANDPNKGQLSKGYKVSNIILENGQVDPNNFNITPAYPPWSSNPSNVISIDELRKLDTVLTVYDNCPSSNPKPSCDNYYYARPIEVGSNLTNQPKATVCTMDNSFQPIKQCFYHPWYNVPGEGNNAVPGGLNYVNPYAGVTAGLTGGSLYSWVGIGNLGYMTTPLLCETQKKSFAPSGVTGVYIIPENNDTVCLNLSAPPQQCSNSFSEIFSVVAQANLSELIKIYEGLTGPYTTPVTSVYPQPAGTTNYSCNVEYTNNTVIDTPGCIQTCRYVPMENDIDFTAKDENGNSLSGFTGDTALQDLLGHYLLFYVNDGSKEYFLGTQNIPCKNSSNADVPLMACLGSTGSVYNQTPCTFIYNGGTGIDAGNYWSKNGCDSESIELATEMRIIVSPASLYTGFSVPAILCDLYAYINGTFGYLSVGNTAQNITTNSSIDISSYFYQNPGNNLGNIVANFNANSSTDLRLYFNALEVGQEIPRNQYNTMPHFIIARDTNQYTIRSTTSLSVGSNIIVDSYDGVNYNQGAFDFDFVADYENPPANIPYFKKLKFDDPLIKTSGIYVGQNVTKTINLQRRYNCYNKTLCDNTSGSGICYNDTCNLYFTYDPEFCN